MDEQPLIDSFSFVLNKNEIIQSSGSLEFRHVKSKKNAPTKYLLGSSSLYTSKSKTAPTTHLLRSSSLYT